YKETPPDTPEWIEFTIDDQPDATVYRIHHPLFQTNTEKRAMRAAQADSDDFEMARALLGDQFAQFDQDGGQVSDLILLLASLTDTMQETDDEGNPTT
ncbi:MAG: hypothetical protein K2I40_05400, partial [Bifidobacterium castoris]|nr:hypothetical protein [Bifidobacterium castoris]